jgi:MFS transporter, PPP family, 3-phenylpropionic acid transporter
VPAPPPAVRAAAVLSRPLPIVVRLSAFYAAFFVVVGVLQPFWPLWLEAKGLSPAAIGLVLAIGIGAKVIGLPIAAHVADRSGERQRLIAALAGASILAWALFGTVDGFWPIVLVSLVFFSLWPPVMSLAESLTVAAARDDGFQYGRVRLWGSIAFIVTSLAAGAALVRLPAEAVFWMILAAVSLTFLTCLRLPDRRSEPSTAHRLPVLALLRQRPFMLMLIACGLIQGSHAVYYAFGAIHWRAAGYAEDVIGALWAEGVICEVLLFAYGARLMHRLGAARLIALAGFAAAGRWLGTGATTELLPLAILQVLHAVSFGAAHLGAMHWIATEVPPPLSATAQSLYSAIVWGVFLGIMLWAAGLLYARLEAGAFMPMAMAALAGSVLALVLFRYQAAASPAPPPA